MKMQCWVKGLVATWMKRELSYGCSCGSGRAMGNSTGCNSAKDVRRVGLASIRYRCHIIIVMLSGGVLLEYSPR